MTSLFVEQLTVLDCALLDPERGLLGQSWLVDIELEGALDDQSMVLDFGVAKKRLKRAIDDGFDHRLLVPRRCPALTLRADEHAIALSFTSAVGTIHHRSPAVAVQLIESEHVDADAVIAALQPTLRAAVPDTVSRIGVSLREERIEGVSYRYAHGLRKHQGHCQRIAHGHRSRLHISVDGVRDGTLERAHAERWRDVYLASRNDLLNCADDAITIGYDAPEGRFELTVPGQRCALLDTDTTVECIAEHIADACARQRPGRRVEVRAFEGVMKGAVCRRA